MTVATLAQANNHFEEGCNESCESKLLIYVDGLAFHSEVHQRVHDNKITNRLQMMRYLVLRFLGTETHNTPGKCVAQIKQARPQ